MTCSLAQRPSIGSLFLGRGPSAICLKVIQRVVDPVYRPPRWANPHVGKKTVEVHPFSADAYPSSTIALERDVRRFRAATNHSLPRVHGTANGPTTHVAMFSVCETNSSSRFSREATTTLSVPLHHGTLSDNDSCATGTQKFPVVFAADRVAKPDGHKPGKGLP
jgi:hypothetical protein